MIAELLGGEVLLSELLSGGSFVRQADVFTSASTSLGLNGSAFFNSSTAPTAGSLAQLNGGSLYQSLLSVSAESSPSIVAAIVNTGFVESFGSGAIAFVGGSDSNVVLLSSSSAALSVVSGTYEQSSSFFAQSPSSADVSAGSYFLSVATANAFSCTSLPSNAVKNGLLHADAQSSTSYSGIGVLRYAPRPDAVRPQEVRYMYRPARN
jgi:hypothetical protein